MDVLLALAAIIVWSFGGFFGSQLTRLNSLFVVGIACSVGGLFSLARPSAWKIPAKYHIFGVLGIFGNQFFYFSAFGLAPAIEVNLLNYLWPLLIVILSPLMLTNYPLKWNHLIGGMFGLVGAVLIVSGDRLDVRSEYILGYLSALSAAITWSLYSLWTKRQPAISTSSIGAFCIQSGIVSLSLFGIFGGRISQFLPLTHREALYLILAGIGPMGAAYYLWGAALKRGDPRRIGSLAYLTPLLSTLNLWLLGGYSLGPLTLAAMILVISGAVIGSLGSKQ
jgi:drug/metabolite transporter (DMT)-like permease